MIRESQTESVPLTVPLAIIWDRPENDLNLHKHWIPPVLQVETIKKYKVPDVLYGWL